jgi:hypothetical protein
MFTLPEFEMTHRIGDDRARLALIEYTEQCMSMRSGMCVQAIPLFRRERRFDRHMAQ